MNKDICEEFATGCKMRRWNSGDILQESNYLEGVFRNINKKSF
jgi:hypothetical protein